MAQRSPYVIGGLIQLIDVKAADQVLLEAEQAGVVHGLDDLVGELAAERARHVLHRVHHRVERRLPTRRELQLLLLLLL